MSVKLDSEKHFTDSCFAVKLLHFKRQNLYLYHTKTILTNQIVLFEGYNGSYFPPRHVPKIRTAFSMVQVSYITFWQEV